jgi:branched-chain amino acid transport system substrate-binding protein
VTIFEEHAPFTSRPQAAEFIKTYHDRAAKAGFPDTSVEVQAAASFTAWQILEAAVNGTKSLDRQGDGRLAEEEPRHTIQGSLRFDGPSNYGDDLMRIKQVQNGKWNGRVTRQNSPHRRQDDRALIATLI